MTSNDNLPSGLAAHENQTLSVLFWAGLDRMKTQDERIDQQTQQHVCVTKRPGKILLVKLNNLLPVTAE
jgi:hypothetical protein